MTLEAVRKPLGMLALAAAATACGGPAGASFGSIGQELAWDDEKKVVASDAVEFDQLGYSVSLGTDRALLGAYGRELYKGAAYVFSDTSEGWTEEQTLVASDGIEGDDFGWSVSLEAERALVGAYARASFRGAAYVFARSDASWTEEQTLVASDGVEGDNFAWSISLGTDRALAGAYGSDAARGAAYVFVRSGGSWTEEQKLVASDAAPDDKLGYAVALGADRLLVGAPGSGASLGAAYVFVRSDAGWREEQKLVASDGETADHFGASVALDENRALVAAYWHDSLRGAAYVFVRNGSTWTEEQKLVASDELEGDRFGNSVALATDRALIGAYANDTARGAAYAFVRSGSEWTEEQKLVASDGTFTDLFGWSVSLARDRALVGAHYDDNLRGAAYVFSAEPASGDPCATGAGCAREPDESSDDDAGCSCRMTPLPKRGEVRWVVLVLALPFVWRVRRADRA